MQIGHQAFCVVRQGGHQGYRIDYDFLWFYDDSGEPEEQLTVSGTYKLQLHNPTTDTYQTLIEYPYGFTLARDSADARTDRISPRRPYWVFDHIRLETSWKIDESGQTGTEVTIVGCTLEPPPEGQSSIPAPVADAAATPTGPTETFVHTADPSPDPILAVESWLICGPNNEGRNHQTATWGVSATSKDDGPADGFTISGVARFYTRTADSQYTLAGETSFARYLRPNEQAIVDGYLDTPRAQYYLAATKLEVEWRVNLGTEVDPATPIQKILRTTACST